MRLPGRFEWSSGSKCGSGSSPPLSTWIYPGHIHMVDQNLATADRTYAASGCCSEKKKGCCFGDFGCGGRDIRLSSRRTPDKTGWFRQRRRNSSLYLHVDHNFSRSPPAGHKVSHAFWWMCPRIPNQDYERLLDHNCDRQQGKWSFVLFFIFSQQKKWSDRGGREIWRFWALVAEW